MAKEKKRRRKREISLLPPPSPFINCAKESPKQKAAIFVELFFNHLHILCFPDTNSMDEYHYLRRSHVPAFGSWEYCANAAALDDLPFTQCFESARQPAAAAAGFFPIYTAYDQDQDLYVAGDLYRNDVVTPTMIVVSRAGGKKGRQGKEQGRTMIKKKKKIDDDDDGWMHCDAVKVAQSPEPTPRKPPKAVDEDLYKISPELLHTKPKKKRRAGLFSSCLLPTCVS